MNMRIVLCLGVLLPAATRAAERHGPKDLTVLGAGAGSLLQKSLLAEAGRQYQARRKALAEAMKSPRAMAAYQKRLREAYRRLLGPMPDKTPLRAKVTGVIRAEGYRIEKVIYESFPKHRVTALLYVPTAGKGPFPGVLFACGHSSNGKAYSHYQAAPALMARNGLVVLAYDPICQGERHQLLEARRHGTTTHTLLNLGALLVARSVVWYEAWDGIRGIDYLLGRPEVDRGKPVGMTGTSGGGTQTTFLMAVDERIGPAAPSCYVMTRMRKFQTLGPADGCQHLPGEGFWGIDHADYCLMRAPKPTAILAARRDFFDIAATREAAKEVGAAYRLLKAGPRFQLFESDTKHGFLPPHRQAATRWMRRWLLDDDRAVTETPIKALPDKQIQVTRSGQVVRDFKDERTVAAMDLALARDLAARRKAFWRDNPRKHCLQRVRELIGLGKPRPAVKAENVGVVQTGGSRIEKLIFRRDRGAPIAGLLFRPAGQGGKRPATLYVDGRGKAAAAAVDGRIVLAIDARGFGETADRGSNSKYFNHEHRVAVLARHIGRTLLGLRVEDVLAAVDYLATREDVDAARIDLVGVGRAGPVALHAAALDRRFASLTLRKSIGSWIDDVVAQPMKPNLMGHVVPSALLYYDLPDLAAAVKPRPIKSAAEQSRQVLYNGIVLPKAWPPKIKELSREPMAVPYLKTPPKVIPIDVGRQLFVDDFLIEKTTLERTFHLAKYYPGNPVLEADRPWETEGRAPYAMPFSDGVWFDPKDRKFKIWYFAGGDGKTCYAESADGVKWVKPKLDVYPGTNIVMKQRRDSCTVWLDHAEKDPQRRFKMFPTMVKGRWVLGLRCSPDGIHWTQPLATSPAIGDRTTVFYNPFRKVWVLSLRQGYPRGIGRSRRYREHADALAALAWTGEDVTHWLCADRLDPHHPKFKDIQPQLYNFDAVAYESLLLGLLAIHQGPPNRECSRRKIHKRNEVLLGFSRDGFHWHRPDRRRFLRTDETDGKWNWGNVQSAGGGCLIVGDKLYFYVSGRMRTDKFWDGHASTGLATLRRDGFASMDATAKPAALTTRPVTFRGKHLFVNLAAPKGELRVEVLGADGEPVAPLTRENCTPIKGDRTLAAVRWRGASDLSALAGKPVRFRFHLTAGSLYAFWVAADANGASGGYVAAGGPGFVGPRDTVGRSAYEAAGQLKGQ